jgi:two-component system, chemotaxis family, sensor kinase CheA
MDLRRFLDLYVAETQEHVRLLHGSLLEYERTAGRSALDEAFRAAHTIKGLSAAMGYRSVADTAHGLEDRLDEVRSSGAVADVGSIDALLVLADSLEAAITVAVAGGVAVESVQPDVPAAAPGPLPAGAVPPATETIALVRLRSDAPIKAARALLVLRALAGQAGVLGSDPATFDDEFGGDFRIFLSGEADAAAVAAAVAGAGEVESVELVEPARARPASALPATRGAAPGRQLRIDAQRLDGLAEGIGELSVLYGRLEPEADWSESGSVMLNRMGAVLQELQHDILQLRMAPLRELFQRLPRAVRDAARLLDRQVEFTIAGDDVELDRTSLEELGDPLLHLLRNAVDHGIEPAAERAAAGKPEKGRIELTALRERSSVLLVLSDDGRGIAVDRILAKAKAAGLVSPDVSLPVPQEELLRLLSAPGISAADSVSAVSGRGVGMDVVLNRLRALGGAIEMRTEPGRGTSFQIRLPITRALVVALRVRIGDEHYAIPLTHVAEAVELNGAAPSAGGSDAVLLRGVAVPVVRLRRVLGVPGTGAEHAAVIAEFGGRRAGLAVDELVGREQILVKGFDPAVGTLPFFSGATLLADGRAALVLDPLSVI